METNSDAFFAMGKTHMVCQDYARAGKTRDGRSYAVVCDGCSSSPDTDFGARLLAVAAETQMQRGVIPDPTRTLEMIKCNIEWLELSQQSFDATMVAALQEPDCIRVRMWGDGAVAARRRDGRLELSLVEHQKNAPVYLSYRLDEKRQAGHQAMYGVQYKVSSCLVKEDPSWSIFCGTVAPKDWVFDVNEYDLVAVMSDGISSFQCLNETQTSKELINVPAVEVLRELLAFKTHQGAFVQRRCHKFLTKACPPRAWQHADDLAVGVVWVGER